MGDSEAIQLHFETAEQILASFEDVGLFQGDVQIEAVRERVVGLRGTLGAQGEDVRE